MAGPKTDAYSLMMQAANLGAAAQPQLSQMPQMPQMPQVLQTSQGGDLMSQFATLQQRQASLEIHVMQLEQIVIQQSQMLSSLGLAAATGGAALPQLGAGSKRPFEDAGHMPAKRKAPE